MDLVTVFIGVFFLAICMMPFILAARSNKKKDKKLLHSLADVAKLHNCTLSQQDFGKEIAIGLCENNNALIFFRQGKNKTTAEYVNLSEVKNCKLIHSSKTVPDKEGTHKSSETVGLSLSFIHKHKPNLILDFYKVEENYQLSGELKLAQKWVHIINGKIKPVPQLKTVLSH
jgi:hypothetical protein